MFSFVVNFDTEPSKHTVWHKLSTISDIFTYKYGEPISCSAFTDFHVDLTNINHCKWRFGDIRLSTDYSNDNNAKRVIGSVLSNSRVVQSYNTRIIAIDMKYGDKLDKIRSIEESVQKSIVKDAAESF